MACYSSPEAEEGVVKAGKHYSRIFTQADFNMVSITDTLSCTLHQVSGQDADAVVPVQSTFSIIILDDIERLLEYVAIGPRFSNAVLQTLLVLLKKQPPKGRKLLVLGTTSSGAVMEDMEISTTFNVVLTVPKLKEPEIHTVLKSLSAFIPDEVRDAKVFVQKHVVLHAEALIKTAKCMSCCSRSSMQTVSFICTHMEARNLHKY